MKGPWYPLRVCLVWEAAQGSRWEAADGVDSTIGRGTSLCCITQPLGHSFLDPRSRYPIVPKTGLKRVRMAFA